MSRVITFQEIEVGTKIIINKEPFEIIKAKHLFKGRGQAVLQVKLKNLKTENIISKTFHPSDKFEEAEITEVDLKFIFKHREKVCFSIPNEPSKRFFLKIENLGEKANFLKENMILKGLFFREELINVILPIKVQLKVISAPPGVKGQRETPGTKQVVLETGARINTPLFIKSGDIIEVNTETGEYVRRIN